jgi:hypothetical protein
VELLLVVVLLANLAAVLDCVVGAMASVPPGCASERFTTRAAASAITVTPSTAEIAMSALLCCMRCEKAGWLPGVAGI